MPSYAQVHLAVERIPPGPWIYARLTDDGGPGGPPAEDGALVEVVDAAGRFCGHGIYNSTSDIRVRMLARGRRTDLDRPREFLNRAVAGALRLRRKTLRLDAVTDAYRIVHAEGDDLPGLVIDKLGDALVCQYHSLGFWRLREELDAIVRGLLPAHAVLHRFARTARNAEGFPEDDPGIDGDDAPERTIREHGVGYRVHPGEGHKTGWFCDQRDNRLRIAALAEDRDVLDLCCHAGGFSIPAALAGARSVMGVDLDEEPLERAARSAAENRVDVEFRHADAFDVLREVNRGRRRPGIVILDPHKLAKGKRDLEAAKIKYRDLNALGIAAVAPGGLVATFSCSGALELSAFAGLVFQAARRAERQVRLLEVLGAGPDHPQRPDFGRSRYLKGLLLSVD
ncbi:MAG: class I SAM-dependent rRNA methyltransferase [Planctomycetota bacterium]